jgi:hypothetical protein
MKGNPVKAIAVESGGVDGFEYQSFFGYVKTEPAVAAFFRPS